MPSFLVDGALTGIGLHFAFQYADGTDNPKLLRVISLIIGLIVFVLLPYYFDDVNDTGNKEQDVALEAVYDTFIAGIRTWLSSWLLLIGTIIIVRG